MIKYYNTVDDVNTIIHGDDNVSMVILLIARYSDVKGVYSKLKEDTNSLENLLSDTVVLGVPIEANKYMKTKHGTKNNTYAMITEIINEFKIKENKIPCLYLYDTLDNSHSIVQIDDNVNIYKLLKNIIVARNNYIGKNHKKFKKKQWAANNMELIASKLNVRENALNKFFSKTENIVKLGTVLTGAYTGVSIIANKIYQFSCQNFYHIPSKYFNTDISDKASIMLFMVLFMCVPLLAYFEKKYLISDGAGKITVIAGVFSTTIFAILIMCYLNIINLSVILDIIEKRTNSLIVNFIYNNINIIEIVTLVLAAIGVLSIVLFDNIVKIKNKIIKKIIQGVAFVSLFFNMVLFVYSMIFTISSDVSEKTKYEVLLENNIEYIILSNYNDKVLVVNFDMDEDEKYIFYTSQYKFVDKYSGVYRYITLNCTPIIE